MSIGIYDYERNVEEDFKNWLRNEWEELKEKNSEEIFELAWVRDDITGNGSGSYTFNSYDACNFVFGNEDILDEIELEWGIDDNRKWDWEYLDVSIRCWILEMHYFEWIQDISEEKGG